MAEGEINFGMKKSEVTRKWEKFENENRVPDKFLKGFYNYYIGNYEFFTHYEFYFENGLYRLQILGGHSSWEDYDMNIPKSFNAIRAVISAKYGEPEYLIPIPKRHELSKGINIIATWLSEKKKSI